jgi:hypothetical protein
MKMIKAEPPGYLIKMPSQLMVFNATSIIGRSISLPLNFDSLLPILSIDLDLNPHLKFKRGKNENTSLLCYALHLCMDVFGSRSKCFISKFR